MYHRHYPCSRYLHGSEIHRCCLSDHRLKCCDHCSGLVGTLLITKRLRKKQLSPISMIILSAALGIILYD